jgi:hypothetical protein
VEVSDRPQRQREEGSRVHRMAPLTASLATCKTSNPGECWLWAGVGGSGCGWLWVAVGVVAICRGV